MIRLFRLLLTSLVLLSVPGAGLAQPSVFQNPSIDLTTIRKFTLLPFTADQSGTVRDPFASDKATIIFTAHLRKRNLQLIDFSTIVRRVGEDTRVDFSGQSTDEKIRIFLSELPKHVDAVLVGHVSAWGLFNREDTVPLRVPVYGYVSWGTGGASWRTSSWIAVQRTTSMSIVGLSVAILRVSSEAPPTLAWQYNHVHTDSSRHRPPDVLAGDFLNDIASSLPLRP